MVEVGSPSTRVVDRTRKLADYRLGGADLYMLVDLPGGAVTEVTFTTYDFRSDRIITALSVIDLVIAGRTVRLSVGATP